MELARRLLYQVPACAVFLGTTPDLLMGKTQHWNKYVGSGMGLLLDNVNHHNISLCHFSPK